MDSDEPDNVLGTNTPTIDETDPSDVLSDWNAKLSKEKDITASVRTRVAGNSARLTQKSESMGTKDAFPPPPIP